MKLEVRKDMYTVNLFVRSYKKFERFILKESFTI